MSGGCIKLWAGFARSWPLFFKGVCFIAASYKYVSLIDGMVGWMDGWSAEYKSNELGGCASCLAGLCVVC